MGYIAQALAKRVRTPEETLASQIGNLERRISSVGAEVPKPQEGFFSRLLTDYLQRPQRAITGLLKEIAQPGETFEPLQELKRGLTGEARVSGKELMQVLGVSDKPFVDTELNIGSYTLPVSFSPSGVAGFLTEMVLDPLNYLAVGAGGALKGGLKLSTKSAPLGLARLLPEASVTVPGTQVLGRSLDELLDITGRVAKFRKGFTQAVRGFAPAGETVRVVKEAAEAVPAKTTRTVVPELLDALKPPAVSGLPESQTVDVVEQGLRNLYRTLPEALEPAAARGFAAASPEGTIIKALTKPLATPIKKEIWQMTREELGQAIAKGDVAKKLGAELLANKGIKHEELIRQALDAGKQLPAGTAARIVQDYPGLLNWMAAHPKAFGPALANEIPGAILPTVTEPFGGASLDAIARVLATTPNRVLKFAEKAARAGVSEDAFVNTLTKALRPVEGIPEGMKLRSVMEGARQAIPESVAEYSAPLKGAELLGYKVGSNKLVQALGDAFKPYFGLHEKAAEAARGVKRGLTLREEEIVNRARNIVKIVPNEADRIAITKWLDDPAANALPRHLERIGNLIKQRFENLGRTEQEAGLLGEMWDTYVTHIYKDDPAVVNKALNKWAKMAQRPISTTLGFAKERALPTLEAAKSLGLTPEYDVAKILAIRELASARAMQGVQFVNELKKLPFLVSPEASAPADFVKVVGVKGLEGMRVAPDVGKFLTKMNKVFGDSEAVNTFVKGWDRMTTLWKAYATVTNPGFSFRNMFGNFFNNWLADIDAKMYAIAKKVTDNADGKIGKYTYDQIRQLAKEQGITQGFYGIELRRLLGGDVNALTKGAQWWNPLSTEFAPIAAGRKLGEAIEVNARMAHFIDRLVRGDTAEKARESVVKYLFDYGELTQFEKEAVRRIVPFYTWTRKNIPLQLEALLTKPGKFAQVGRVQEAIETAAGGKELEEQPRWVRESGAVVTPITDENGRLILSPRMPYEDIAKLAPSDALSNLLSMLHPLPKMAFELGAKYSAFQRRPIQEFEGQEVPFGTGTLPAKAAYLARQVPFVQNIERLLQESRAERRLLDLLASLAGVKFYTEKETKTSAQYERLKQLQDLVSLLKQRGIAVPTITELESRSKLTGGRKSIASILAGAKKR